MATRLSGTEWEDWGNQILVEHYGPTEYQRVPDNDKGDAGIEGYTIESGHAYQLYGCEEPVSTKSRYEHQRDKMTEDIGKFVANTAKLTRILGTVKVSRWVLFVPHFDSQEIVAHATKKTGEVTTRSLPYVAEDFEVVVCDEQSFASARDHLMNVSDRRLRFDPATPTEDQLATWEADNSELASVLESKLHKLPTMRSDSQRANFRSKIIAWYLEGQQLLDELREYPTTYERAIRAKRNKENYLALKVALAESGPTLLNDTLKEMQETLATETTDLHQHSAIALAHEAAADWMLRCPLDFPDAETP